MAIVRTRAEALGIHLDIFDGSKQVFDGTKPLEEMFDLNKYCGILVHYPDTNGNVDDLTQIVAQAKKHETIVIAATDPLALTVVKAPGEYGPGCDIAIGTAQRFGKSLARSLGVTCRNPRRHSTELWWPTCGFSRLPPVLDSANPGPCGWLNQRCTGKSSAAISTANSRAAYPQR